MDTLRGPAGLPGCLAGRAPSPGALPQCEGNEKKRTFARLPHFFFNTRTAYRPRNAQPPHVRPVAGDRHRRDGQSGSDDPEQKARSGNPQRKHPVQTAPRKPFRRPPRESNGETGAETQTPEKDKTPGPEYHKRTSAAPATKGNNEPPGTIQECGKKVIFVTTTASPLSPKPRRAVCGPPTGNRTQFHGRLAASPAKCRTKNTPAHTLRQPLRPD